jgi:hypothetical protein
MPDVLASPGATMATHDDAGWEDARKEPTLASTWQAAVMTPTISIRSSKGGGRVSL